MSLDGSVKEYVVDNNVDIQIAPDILFELINFTKYEKNSNAKKMSTQDKEDRQSLPEASNIVASRRFQATCSTQQRV